MERFEQPKAGPKGEGQEARSKSHEYCDNVGRSLPQVEMTMLSDAGLHKERCRLVG
jgi:hypothetical protein